ncbi:MAG TPA: LytS/YhcK type 5TM receptor domain-containing protein [Bacteroidales bacterium]|nr:LytS/YhcK type 5TM receptor domain-containing protein [Bacteroidales bacterium]
MIILELISNLTLLLALGVLSGFIDKRWDRHTIYGKLSQGLLFGIVCVIGLLKPVVYAEGIIFDGRSIVISLASLFFGPISGVLTAVIAAGMRINLGGQGMLMGLLCYLRDGFQTLDCIKGHLGLDGCIESSFVLFHRT